MLKILKENYKSIIGELLGSAFISFWGLGFIIPFVVTGYLDNMFEFAIWFGIAFAITVVVFAPISGVHVNPGVTLAWATFGGFNWKLVPYYIISQIVGWGIGVVPIYLIYSNKLLEWSLLGNNPSTLFYCNLPTNNIISGALLEIVMTMLLTFSIFLFLDINIPNRPTPSLFPIAIGSVISFLVAFGGGYTGTCINTARDLGPRIIGYIYGKINGYNVSNVFNCVDWVVYIVAPCMGALLGGFIYFKIIKKLLPMKEKE